MMKHSLQRLLVLLAATDWRERDVFDALLALDKENPAYLADRVMQMRDEMRRFSDHYQPRMKRLGSRKTTPSSDVASRISTLLRNEAGLTVAQAAELLIQAIEMDGVMEEGNILPPNREAFARWISRVGKQVPPRQLLHYATQIRNSLIHRPVSDWPLKGRDD